MDSESKLLKFLGHNLHGLELLFMEVKCLLRCHGYHLTMNLHHHKSDIIIYIDLKYGTKESFNIL